MKHEFTIKTLSGYTIELSTEEYHGQENWIGEVWEDGDCIFSCLNPDGINSLRECEKLVAHRDELAEQLAESQLIDEILDILED